MPYVGPFLGALPPIIVALFQDPLTAVWVGLLFLALQQLEGHVVAPKVFGHTLRINPLLVIFALLFGAEIYGFVGALIALPIAAVLRETVIYLRRRHLVLDRRAGPAGAPGQHASDPRRALRARARGGAAVDPPLCVPASGGDSKRYGRSRRAAGASRPGRGVSRGHRPQRRG